MTFRGAAAVIALAGGAFFALSFVNAWIAQTREIRGEGYRFVEIALGAWRGAGIPVLSVAAFVALLVAGLATATLLGRRSVPGWALVGGSALVLGLVLASAWPVTQTGHASDVRLAAGALLPIGALLALGMAAGAIALVRPPRMAVVAAVGVVAIALVGGAGSRWLVLQLSEGSGRHWSEGSYTRTATEDEPTEVMSIAGERVSIGDRWAGSWEWSGWAVVIDGDPACPDSRGTYHAHDAGGEDIRFVKVLDTCRDGERAADLETGIWARDP